MDHTVRTRSAYGGALKYSTAKNATVSATFQGTGVAWVSETGPTLGTATVYLDGVAQKTVNLYSADGARTSDGVEAGLVVPEQHTRSRSS